jgi:hypothetical protein
MNIEEKVREIMLSEELSEAGKLDQLHALTMRALCSSPVARFLMGSTSVSTIPSILIVARRFSRSFRTTACRVILGGT